MINGLIVLTLLMGVPFSVDSLPLSHKVVVLEPTFEAMMIGLREALQEKERELDTSEKTYSLVREYSDPVVKDLGISGFISMSFVYVYLSMESGMEWADAMLPVIIVDRVYESRIEWERDLEAIAVYIDVENYELRRFFFTQVLRTSDENLVNAIEELLREKWSKDDHCCNGLLDFVYEQDAFEGWSLWHKLIGTEESDRVDLLSKLDVLRQGYSLSVKTEDVLRKFYKLSKKNAAADLEAGLAILRELVNEGGLPEKVFVAAILERAPVFRAEDIVAKLQEVEHPFVKIRLRYLDEDED